MGGTSKKSKLRGYCFLLAWAILIVAGIVEKRIFNNPNVMVFYHLPAAVCLVVGWYLLSEKVRQRYRESLQRFSSQSRSH